MKNILLITCLIVGSVANTQTARWNNTQPYQQSAAVNPSEDQRGFAVYYADYYEGSPTALGEIFHQSLMTAAHQQLPLGTIVKVTRVDNGMTTTVRINDRGAYCEGCVIDLSKAAATEIDLLRVGRTQVILTVVGFSNTNPMSRNEAIFKESADPRLTARGGEVQTSRVNTYEQPAATSTALPFRAPAATSRGQINTVDARNIPANNNTDWAPSSYSNTTTTRKSPVSSPVSVLDNATATYAVQLGSYGQFSNAERHVLSLEGKGFNNVFVWQDTRPDGSLINRVVVAPFTSLAQAQDYLRDLRTLHQIDGLVVQTR
jgi:rare lipoprotein A